MSDTGSLNASLDDDEEEGEEESSGGLNPKKLILFIVLPLLIIGGGAGAYFMGLFEPASSEQSTEESEHAGKGGHSGGKANANATFLKIPDMIVNLSSSDGQPRYLRLSVQLELKSEGDKIAVEQVMPRVIDQFQTYLRELRVKDLRGSAGIYRLQMELLSRVNAAAYPVEVQDVLFQEILIQ